VLLRRVVGYSKETNFGSYSLLIDGSNPFNAIGQVEGVNRDGSAIVGRGVPMFPLHASRFTSWDARLEDLGALFDGGPNGARSGGALGPLRPASSALK
jgi:hypothetical protein